MFKDQGRRWISKFTQGVEDTAAKEIEATTESKDQVTKQETSLTTDHAVIILDGDKKRKEVNVLETESEGREDQEIPGSALRLEATRDWMEFAEAYTPKARERVQ